MREPGEAPMFNHLIDELTRARTEWNLGNRGKAEAILRVVASIAYAEARERAPSDPVPESRRPIAPSSRRDHWHYDSQGYCDNPGRGY